MNTPPETSLRVSHLDLHAFVARAAQSAGLASNKAERLAELLTLNDLRGVFSHGTVQVATYARLMREGVLNANPEPHIVQETPVSLLMDGDGGLGYFPAYEGTLKLIEKVETSGIGVLLTRNHGHFGAAGLYSRLTLAHDMLAFVTSGVQLSLPPGAPLYHAAGGSPMSFSAPTLDEDPLVLDFGTMHDLYDNAPYRDDIAEKTPGLVLRAIGMGAVCQAWGGLLAGVPIDESRAMKTFSGANQGSMVIAFKISLFTDPEIFNGEMDEYVRAVRQLTPLPGFDEAYLPGGVEAARERHYREESVPLSEDHREKLETLARDFGLEVPWN
jgi:L-2-hydroxycarboxylate dehydrogenase (NAD+)